MNRATVFVHYDRHNIVDDYVYFYLRELQYNSSYLVFVSTTQLSQEDVITLSKYCSQVIIRENIGYDFMSYKIGLESFDYASYDEVLICNDSVYGPFISLETIFEEMQKKGCDFWGMTDNSDMAYHLQSYFLVFRKSVLQSREFYNFWNEVTVLHNKDDLIEQYEVGLSKVLLENGFKSAVYAEYTPTYLQKALVFAKKLTPQKIYGKIFALLTKKHQLKRVGRLNTSHYFYKELLLLGKMPFIKIELLRDNPLHINITDVADTLLRITDYDISLINKHLTRMKEDKCTK